ncbi:MAG: CopD family protein [Pseudomonadota bacterium]|nr:CopD family protein [Pseudomonadota bacterium]
MTAAIYPYVLTLHVLGATVWAGGHLVLSLSVVPKALRENDPTVISEFEHLYERLGIPALIVQLVTGFWMAHFLLENVYDLFSFSNRTNTLVSTKLILMLITVVLAIDARLRVIPKLDAGRLRSLAYHVYAVTAVAVVFVVIGVSIRMPFPFP